MLTLCELQAISLQLPQSDLVCYSWRQHRGLKAQQRMRILCRAINLFIIHFTRLNCKKNQCCTRVSMTGWALVLRKWIIWTEENTKCKNSALEPVAFRGTRLCPSLDLSTAGGYTCTGPVCCGIWDLNKLPVIVNVSFLCGLSGVCAASCPTHQCQNKCTLLRFYTSGRSKNKMFLNRASIRWITKLCAITHLTKMNILFDNSLLWIQVCVNTKSSRENIWSWSCCWKVFLKVSKEEIKGLCELILSYIYWVFTFYCNIRPCDEGYSSVVAMHTGVQV